MSVDPNNRPIRVINDDTTEQEFAAGLRIPNADPPKNEKARGGFGNREGKEGYGTDSEDGITAVSVNADADQLDQPHDNMRTAGEIVLVIEGAKIERSERSKYHSRDNDGADDDGDADDDPAA